MKVFVEGTPIFRQRTGVGRYTKSLLEALFRLDKTNHYTIFGFLFLGRTKHRPIPGEPESWLPLHTVLALENVQRNRS